MSEKNEGVFKDLSVAEGTFPLSQILGLSSKTPTQLGLEWLSAGLRCFRL